MLNNNPRVMDKGEFILSENELAKISAAILMLINYTSEITNWIAFRRSVPTVMFSEKEVTGSARIHLTSSGEMNSPCGNSPLCSEFGARLRAARSRLHCKIFFTPLLQKDIASRQGRLCLFSYNVENYGIIKMKKAMA